MTVTDCRMADSITNTWEDRLGPCSYSGVVGGTAVVAASVDPLVALVDHNPAVDHMADAAVVGVARGSLK